MRHTMVVDLGFGDAGKGTVVDHLCRVAAAEGRPVAAVVRFNGGAQAAHNVVTDDGRHHTFAQFGAGTLAGVPTHLSRDVLLDPLALAAEAAHLAALGVPNPFAGLTVHRDALLTTPYHAAANQLRELARGDARHGSCGMGVGETAAYALAHPDRAPRAGDCAHPARLRRLLVGLRDSLEAELGPLTAGQGRRPVPSVEACTEVFAQFAAAVRFVDDLHLSDLARHGPLVFEGAQGVLLDEWHGFHPYTTWSTTTFANAEKLLGDAGIPAGDARRLGVLRTYTTRHGAGPLVTEDAALTAALPDRHNGTGRWQGAFRVGHFDAVAHRYALDVAGGVDAVALTHLDVVDRAPLSVCRAYDVRSVPMAGAVAQPTSASARISDWHGFRQVNVVDAPGVRIADRPVVRHVGPAADGREGSGHDMGAEVAARATGLAVAGNAGGPAAWPLAGPRRITRLTPGRAGDLAWSAGLTARLLAARPVLDTRRPDPGDWPDLVAEVCGAPVELRSYGPRSADKR